jgi:hypothetical protein
MTPDEGIGPTPVNALRQRFEEAVPGIENWSEREVVQVSRIHFEILRVVGVVSEMEAIIG